MASSSSSSSNVLLLLLLLLLTAGLILTSLPTRTLAYNHLALRQYMPPGFYLDYQDRYIFEMQRDCNASFRDIMLPNPIWQTYINYDGPKDRCRLEIQRDCKIVILSKPHGIELWGSDTQQANDTATDCFIEVTESLTLYDGDARNKLWVNGYKV